MFHDYPYTDFHEMNLDYILKLCRESLGIHLVVSGNNLQLVNDLNQVLSQVTISFAETAAKDTEGNNITAYLIDAARSGRAIVFTSGDGNEKTVQLPTDALTDINGKDITSYIARVDVSGQKLRITDGAGNAYTFTVPFANAAGKAETDINDKAITSYVADLIVSGDELVVKDGNGNTLRTITVSYADESGTADKARKDLNNNAFLSDYAELIVVDSDGKRIGLDAHDGTRLSTITVPFATLSTDATNAIESVLVNGNQLQFRTYGGTVTNITVPYALKATSDGSNNEIVSNYVADVVNDAQTGKITFLAKDGSTIAELIPTVDSAVHDSYGNTIADFVKTIAVSAGSDYVTVTHGTGDTDSLLIDYSNRAWKDTNGNIIKNVYVANLVNQKDGDDQYVIIAKNGEGSEIFRFVVKAYSAQVDDLGNTFSSTYINDLSYDSVNNKIVAKSPDGSVVDDPQLPSFIANIEEVNVSTSPYIPGENGAAFHGSKMIKMTDPNGNVLQGGGNVLQFIADLRYPSVSRNTPDSGHNLNFDGGYSSKYMRDLMICNGIDSDTGKPKMRLAKLNLLCNPQLWQFQYDWQVPDMHDGFVAMNSDPSVIEIAIPYKTREEINFKVSSAVTINADSTGTIIVDGGYWSDFISKLVDETFIVGNNLLKVLDTTYSYPNSIYLTVHNFDSNSVSYAVNDDIKLSFDWNAYGKNGYMYEYGKALGSLYGGQIQIDLDDNYIDFDQIVDNTVHASLGAYFTTNSFEGSKFAINDSVLNNAKIQSITLYRASNNYDAETFTSTTVDSGGNTVFTCGITNDIMSVTYESANDNIGWFTDGDIITFNYGYGSTAIAFIVKK